MKKKKHHQLKSRWYYWFWCAATLSVVFGQLYVGYGYRLMHGSMLDLIDKVDGVLLRAEPFADPNYL